MSLPLDLPLLRSSLDLRGAGVVAGGARARWRRHGRLSLSTRFAEVEAIVEGIDARMAEATVASDREKIFGAIEGLPGGFDGLNEKMRTAQREWLAAAAEEALLAKESEYAAKVQVEQEALWRKKKNEQRMSIVEQERQRLALETEKRQHMIRDLELRQRKRDFEDKLRAAQQLETEESKREEKRLVKGGGARLKSVTAGHVAATHGALRLAGAGAVRARPLRV